MFELADYIVIKDTREQAGWDFPNMEVGTLSTGDYSLRGYEDIFIVERKGSTGEFSHNLTEKRFERELERLNKIDFPFVVLEFDFEDLVLFPHNSGIPRYKWPHVRLSPKFLVRRLNELQIQFSRIKWQFVGRHGQIYMEDLFKRMHSEIKKCQS